MSIPFILKSTLPIVGSILFEQFFIKTNFSFIYQNSNIKSSISKIYGIVILNNLIFTVIVLLVLGTKVGQSRTKFIDKAIKDGDKDAIERYSYPKMYAEGFSTLAKEFNCIQRSHQHALETYTQFVILSLIAGYQFPVNTIFAGLLWIYSRLIWAKGYQSGDPKKRYQNIMAYGIWGSLLLLLFAAFSTVALIVY